jgi:rhodanese-related sulfurtransferase
MLHSSFYADIFHFFVVKTVSDSLQLTPHDFVEKYGRLKPSETGEIIFSCRSGKRAEDACKVARNLGFKL